MKNQPFLAGNAVGQPVPYDGQEASRAQILAAAHHRALEDDPELTRIAQFAAKLCETGTGLVSLVETETQSYLARAGTDVRETPRSSSFCAHAMLGQLVMEVTDASADPRFAENPLVTGEPHIRFYAGAPLATRDGVPLGALCVTDTAPRPGGLTDFQREGLEVLAAAVMGRLNAHQEGLESQQELRQREAQLRALADSIPDIAWSADADGKLDYHNARFTEYAGGTADENPSLIHPDDFEQTREAWKRARETGEEYEVEHRVRRADGQYRWMIARAVPMKDENGRVLRWFGTTTDIDDTHKLSESREVLARELSHRIKNIFAVIGGLVSLTLRKQPGARKLGDELIGMIQALGRAHRYVDPVAAASSSKLRDLLDELFAPYFTDGESRIEVVGDGIDISPRAVTPLALVFHELATNSAKYGALSAEQGRIHLALERDEEAGLVRFTWTESGGPAPDETASAGFGSQLMDMSISGQLKGKLGRKWLPSGLVVELEVPFDMLST
jgi:PAS domain S-box-containing protein